MFLDHARYLSLLVRRPYGVLLLALLLNATLALFFAVQWYKASNLDNVYLLAPDQTLAAEKTDGSLARSEYEIRAFATPQAIAIPSKKPAVLFSTVQDYHSIGLHQQGLRVMVTHLMHQGEKTYVRLYIDNRRAIPCHLSSPIFEYLTRKRYLLFFSKYKGRVVELLEGPSDLSLPAHSGGYFLFTVPSGSSAGLRVSLREHSGGPSYQLTIPGQVLRKACSQ